MPIACSLRFTAIDHAFRSFHTSLTLVCQGVKRSSISFHHFAILLHARASQVLILRTLACNIPLLFVETPHNATTLQNWQVGCISLSVAATSSPQTPHRSFGQRLRHSLMFYVWGSVAACVYARPAGRLALRLCHAFCFYASLHCKSSRQRLAARREVAARFLILRQLLLLPCLAPRAVARTRRPSFASLISGRRRRSLKALFTPFHTFFHFSTKLRFSSTTCFDYW